MLQNNEDTFWAIAKLSRFWNSRDRNLRLDAYSTERLEAILVDRQSTRSDLPDWTV